MKLTDKLFNSYIEIAGVVAKSPELYPGSQHKMIFYVDVKRKKNGVDTIPVIYDKTSLSAGNIPPVGSPIAVAGKLSSQNDKDRKLIVYADAIMMSIPEVGTLANKVMLEGFICEKKELHKTRGGKDVLTVILAIGEEGKKNIYIPVVTWWKAARYLNTLPIGTTLDIQGVLQSRKYYTGENSQVENVAYEVSAYDVKVARTEE